MFDRPPEPQLEDPRGRTDMPAPIVQPKPIGRPPGKRSDPAWKQFSVLLRKDTHKAVSRILRDREDGQDFSGLVQSLVEDWLKKQG
jgi:hypothetical protein